MIVIIFFIYLDAYILGAEIFTIVIYLCWIAGFIMIWHHYSSVFILLGVKPSLSMGTWVAQLVKHPNSAQVIISQSSPMSGSVLKL